MLQHKCSGQTDVEIVRIFEITKWLQFIYY